MMNERVDENNVCSGVERLNDRRVFERYHAYLKKTAAYDEGASDWMDRTKILLRLTFWQAEHRDGEQNPDELWTDLSAGYGQERMGELLSGMNGTLIKYEPDGEDQIHLTDLGMSVVMNTIRDLHHNCPL